MQKQKQPVVLVSLSWLAKAQALSETVATPHRLFDVDAVRRDSGQDDPMVAMQLIFIECANTGIRAPLHRFLCTTLSIESRPEGASFMVDLIEGLSDLAKAAEHKMKTE